MNKWLRLIIRFFLGIAMVGALVFIPAGTIRFWNGWLFLTILTIPMAVSGVTLMINAPELLTKRLDTKESDPIQRRIILSIGIIFCAAFICAGFDFRFSWSRVPLWVVLPASAVYLAGYGVYVEVIRENAWISRTVKVESEQRVVDKGLYKIVRHPMYTAVVVMFPMFGLILGSWLAFLLLMGIVPLMILRIRAEEETLKKSLVGYAAYMAKVRYRLIPGLW